MHRSTPFSATQHQIFTDGIKDAFFARHHNVKHLFPLFLLP
jgi:hypothetical protein